MTDVLRTVAADLLEAPEEVTKLMGQALQAVGEELQKLSDRIGALEAKIAGGTQ